MLRIPELGFLPPLCAVPPAQDLRAGPVKIPTRVDVPSGRLPCSGIVLIGWRRLIAHGFLPPLARLRCRALPFKGRIEGSCGARWV